MNCKLSCVLIFSLAALSLRAEVNLYRKMQSEFAKAAVPHASDFSSGWYSGRCFLRRDQNSTKAGALVVFNSGDKLTVSMPASSILDQQDYFDNMDTEKYEIYKDLVFLGKNQPAEEKNGSLVSMLNYDVLIGDMHLRQMGKSLVLALTNTQASPLKDENSFFFCKIEKKVMELQGAE